MPRCSWPGCENCNPRNSKEISILEQVIDDIECATPGGGEYWFDSHEGKEYYFPNMMSHPDAYEPWFQTHASAYEAGMKRALQLVKERLESLKGKGH